MKLSEAILFESYEHQITSEEFYHVGPMFSNFDNRFLGTGENNHLLGPGIYLSNDIDDAMQFAKFHSNPYLYTVKIKRDGVLHNVRKPISQYNRMFFDNLANDIGLDSADSLYRVPGVSAMMHGVAPIGGVVKLVGKRKAIDLFVKHAIDGAFEVVDSSSGIIEVAIYNTDVLKIIDKQPL